METVIEPLVGTVVNDVHSQLNATRVGGIVRPASVGHLVDVVRAARDAGASLSVAGGRHNDLFVIQGQKLLDTICTFARAAE